MSEWNVDIKVGGSSEVYGMVAKMDMDSGPLAMGTDVTAVAVAAARFSSQYKV